MKRLLMLLIVVLLAGCEASVDVIEDPVIIQPEIEEPETLVVEEEPQVDASVIKEVITYQIRYYYGYDDVIEDLIVEEGNAHRFSWPSRDGFNFKGWFLDEALTQPIQRISEVREDLVVYAKWEEIIKEPHELVFDEIREHFSFDFETTHPVEYSVSPSSNTAKANLILKGVSNAAGLFKEYLIGYDPISLTVVHPNDSTWYEEAIANLNLVDYGDNWFERTSANGGGAVFDSYDGNLHMVFNVPDSNQISSTNIDWYVHETMHIFQLGQFGRNRDTQLGCMNTEGGAELLGNVLSAVDHKEALRSFLYARSDRISNLRAYYSDEESLAEAVFMQAAYGQNDRCNTQYPRFGYNLGALIAEKMVYDFGIVAYMEMHYQFNEYRIDEVFITLNGVDYYVWLEQEAVPYVIELIS
jgi:uncharacterized repeat protein (TIGR02543 family)